MVRFSLPGALALLFLTLTTALAQTTSGQIELLLTNDQGSPVAGVQARFLSEANAELGRCTTDAAGACLLDLPDAPANASGFIRGTLVLDGHGKRPLIWPGGLLELPQSLDTLAPPVDVYATLGPAPETLLLDLSAPELAATATAFLEGALPTQTPEATVTIATPLPTSPAGVALAQETPAAATDAPAAATDATDAVATPAGDTRFWLAMLLVGLIFIGLTLYASYRAAQGVRR
jgi:hypothetical protein